MQDEDWTIAADAFAAVLEKHFVDLERRSPGMAVGGNAAYLAAVTRRALHPLLRAQHQLVEAAREAVHTGDTTGLVRSLERLSSLSYQRNAAIGTVTRFEVTVDDGRAVGRWDGDVEDDVKEAIAHVAGSLRGELLVDASEAAEMIRFTGRRFASSVEVDYDVVLSTGRRETLSLGDLIRGAARLLE